MKRKVMDKCVVFYSWESDLPNSTNRGFIQKALENAAKSIRDDDSIKVEPVIDRDTQGVPGAPDIPSVIFEKIEQAQMFVCDVSIINKRTKFRKTTNPNVLVELGYAIKTLGLERIVMVMNTAFGKPELLPFDLNKKRVVPYYLPEHSGDKAKERNELKSKLGNALRTIVSHTDKTRTKGKRSGKKDKLKEECEDVLLNGNKQDWLGLVDELWYNIPKKLLEWKPEAEQVWGKGVAEREEAARMEAVEICLPSFVPIFVAVEKGRMDLWQESTGPLRQLLLLSNQMGAGFTDVIEIGSHMLYFAGNLGMAIAARTKQLDFISKWMQLPMPREQHYEADGKPWAEVKSAHYLWGHFMQDRFQEILTICKLDYLSGFFTDKEQLVKYLFLGNLGQSLYELSLYIRDEKDRKSIEDKDKKRFRHDLMVHPVWILMNADEFKAATWELFGSPEGVLKFAFPNENVDTEKFWEWWKNWKEICSSSMGNRPFLSRKANWLTLPGEPI
ncbi:MAG: hypothetical protein FVQ80_04250 [Planctomycetes bacterium]|nr:hypothetical protein [Planctomycetota bacterium]